MGIVFLILILVVLAGDQEVFYLYKTQMFFKNSIVCSSNFSLLLVVCEFNLIWSGIW